jgi:hypothetical protein
MAHIKIFQNNRYQSNYIQYVADSIEDVKKIRLDSILLGSEVYVISEKKTYILGSDKIWYSKATNDDSIIECNCHEESTIWGEIPE